MEVLVFIEFTIRLAARMPWVDLVWQFIGDVLALAPLTAF
jgi:hypothetical protein